MSSESRDGKSTDLKKVIGSLHPLERKALPLVEKNDKFEDLLHKSGLKEIELLRALQWLESKGLVEVKEDIQEVIDLDDNGREYLEKKLPERRFLEVIQTGELFLQDIQTQAGLEKEEVNICIGTLKKKAAIDIKKEDGMKVSITDQGKKVLEVESLEEKFLKKKFPMDIDELEPEEKFAYDNLIKRKQIIKKELMKTRTAVITKTGKEVLKIGLGTSDLVDGLTSEMLKKGSWKGKEFRRYDVTQGVPKIFGGKRHFVNQAIDYIKRIWLDMGFVEMQGQMIQTSFWDLDALFVPQDHPARTMQDTFFLGDPSHGDLPSDFEKGIKAVHEDGGKTGSLGWRYDWSKKASAENILRTHTTVLSAQTIAQLKETDLPAKFFSVGRVFRNETLDWKHLFEFNQVEGIVVDPKGNLKHLKGYLREFYRKMGYTDIKMRPAHFPYTEPSVEIEVYNPIRKEWVELGGAGIFRPEVVKPLLGIDVPVLAWGQGMERIISEYFKITDIRDLYRNDLKQIREMKTWIK